MEEKPRRGRPKGSINKRGRRSAIKIVTGTDEM